MKTIKRTKWDATKSNYNKRGNDLNLSFDPKALDPSLKKIADGIIDLSVPRGKQVALDARVALSKDGWKKWIGQKKEAVDRLSAFKRSNSIAGHVIDLSEFEQREFIRECYEEYLRMAHLGGRSKTTFYKNATTGKLMGKEIIEMTFEDYLKDCLLNLDWRIKKDLPLLKHREEMGYIGIENSEYDKTLQLMKMTVDGIKKFLSMSAEERFIYV
jgi:hypothetical protein